MVSNKAKKEWIIKNCRDKFGHIDLSKLDFSDFDGDINLSGMKVKRNLKMDNCEVGKNLYISRQKVKGYIEQEYQKAGYFILQGHQTAEEITQNFQKFKKELLNYKLESDEYISQEFPNTLVVRKVKKITREELSKMGYILEEDK